MKKDSGTCRILGVCISLFLCSNAYSYEASLETDIGARAEYNDNIFLTDGPHDSVSGIIITPSLSGIIKERHWLAKLDAVIKSQKYSDHSLDGNDQLFSLTGQYSEQRNMFSLNVIHDLGSNLDSISTDFGIEGQRINTTRQSITPQYTRLITERLVLSLSYTYTDIDFEDAENTTVTYTPYFTETGLASLRYNLTEKDVLSISLQGVDYNSKDDLITYRLFTSQIGMEHKFSERLSTNFLVGLSRLNSTNLTTQVVDFLGRPIIVTQEIDFENRTSVYNAGLIQQLETGTIEGEIGRNIVSNSFGGLNTTDKLTLKYLKKVSSLWRYTIRVNISDISSKNTGSDNLSRNVFVFDSIVKYSISQDWIVNVSYGYRAIRRETDTGEDRAPHSNRLYLGLSYNFPSLSTF